MLDNTDKTYTRNANVSLACDGTSTELYARFRAKYANPINGTNNQPNPPNANN